MPLSYGLSFTILLFSFFSSYGTVIYVPSSPVVDFGESSYPSPYEKKVVSPRVLLVSTWTDGKYGLPGGGVKRGEEILQAINREFLEEIGTAIDFSDDDFCYSLETEGKITYHFAKITHDETFFESLLINFHRLERSAYVDEIIGIAGFPVWIEGPLDRTLYSWKNNIWGFPRHLCWQGGSFTPTLQSNYAPRESLVIILLLKGIISSSLMKRIFELSSTLCEHHPESCIPLEVYDSFVSRVGIFDIPSDEIEAKEDETAASSEENEKKRKKMN